MCCFLRPTNYLGFFRGAFFLSCIFRGEPKEERVVCIFSLSGDEVNSLNFIKAKQQLHIKIVDQKGEIGVFCYPPQNIEELILNRHMIESYMIEYMGDHIK